MIAGFAGAALGGVALGDRIGTSTSRALWALLYIALAALIGLGVGMIARHTAGAITGLLMWSFVIESLFAPAIPEGVRHFLPFSAGYRLLDAGPELRGPRGHRRSPGSPAVRPHLRRLRPRQPRHRHAPALPARLQLNPSGPANHRTSPGPWPGLTVVSMRRRPVVQSCGSVGIAMEILPRTVPASSWRIASRAWSSV